MVVVAFREIVNTNLKVEPIMLNVTKTMMSSLSTTSSSNHRPTSSSCTIRHTPRIQSIVPSLLRGRKRRDPMDTAPATSSSPAPSHYHLLRRLVSLCYNSSPKTSYFYAGLLYDLYNAELLAGLSLPVVVAPGEEVDEDADTVHGDSPIRRPRAGRGRGKAGGSSMHALDLGTHDILAEGKVETVDVPKHLALHLKGWSFINNDELYSAIHLVKEHIAKSDEELENKFKWDSEKGVLDYVLGAGLSSDEDDEDDPSGSDDGRAFKLGRKSAPKLKAKGKGKQREKIPTDDLPCLECAMIFSKACEGLARFDEGRNVLERTVKTLERGLNEDEFRE